MFSPSFASIAVLAVSLPAALVHAVSVSVPLTAPANAPVLNPALFSLSIEQDRWAEWAGTTSRNTFFYNTLDNYKERTGVPPAIRLGADSEDHTNYNADVQFSEVVIGGFSTTTPYPEASNVIAGDGFWEIFKYLPSGTRVTAGVNFGQNNLTAAALEARAINKAFQSPEVKAAGVTLDFIEIGNEADFWGDGRGGRIPANWNINEYVTEWNNFATNVSAAVGINPGSHTKYFGGAFALSSHSDTSFSPQGLFKAGLLKTTQGKMVTTISQHRYSGSFCQGSAGILQDLMTKSTIRGNLTIFTPDIAATRAQGLDYVFGETNSYACHGAPGVSNTAGAALWSLDYALYGGLIGISKVYFHLGIGYKYSLIQPVALTRSIIDGSTLSTPLPAHIQPQYYSALIIGEAIGHSGSTKAVEISIDDTRLSGYAFYEGGRLRRAVLINSEAYGSGSTSPRTSKQITFNFSGSGTKPAMMTVKRLKIGHADDVSGVTWGGQSFETPDARPTGVPSLTTSHVSDGVTISATEAILLTFH